jgi:hypothetical protein
MTRIIRQSALTATLQPFLSLKNIRIQPCVLLSKLATVFVGGLYTAKSAGNDADFVRELILLLLLSIDSETRLQRVIYARVPDFHPLPKAAAAYFGIS